MIVINFTSEAERTKRRTTWYACGLRRRPWNYTLLYHRFDALLFCPIFLLGTTLLNLQLIYENLKFKFAGQSGRVNGVRYVGIPKRVLYVVC